MRKKNAALVFVSVLSIFLCITSPMFMSEIQNKNVTGKTKFERMEKASALNKRLTFFKKIEIYKENWRSGEREISSETSELFWGEGMEMDEITESIEKNWSELYQLGIVPKALEISYVKKKLICCSTQTYMNEQYDSVTVREVRLDDFPDECIDIIMEEETRKIIEFSVYSSEHSVIEDMYERAKDLDIGDETMERWLAEQWGNYIGAKVSGEKKIDDSDWQFEYQNGNSSIVYSISICEDRFMIQIL